MGEPLSAAVVTNIIASALWEWGKDLYKRHREGKHTPFKLAIDQAISHHPKPEDAELALQNWINHPSFYDIYEALCREPQNAQSPALVGRFLGDQIANPIAGDDSSTFVAKVFLSVLIQETIKSKDGSLVISQQVSHLGNQVTSGLDGVSESLSGIKRTLETLTKTVARSQDVATETATEEGNKTLGRAIELARELSKAKVHKTALAKLAEAEAELGKPETLPGQRLAYYAIRGIGSLHLDDRASAIGSLRLAYQASPGDPKGIGYIGYALYLEDKFEEALTFLDAAIGQDTSLEFVHAVKAHALTQLGRVEELEPFWELDLSDKLDLLTAIALSGIVLDQFQRVERLLEHNPLTNEHPELKCLLAHAILEHERELIAETVGFGEHNVTRSSARLERVLTLLKEATPGEGEPEAQSQRRERIKLQSAALSLMWRTEEAVSLAEEVVRLEPDSVVALRNLSVLYLRLLRFPDAFALFEKAADSPDLDPDFMALIVEAYATSGRLPEAKTLADDGLAKPGFLTGNRRALLILYRNRACIGMRETDDLESLLEANSSLESEGFYQIAWAEFHESNLRIAEATSHYEKALQLFTGYMQDNVRLQYQHMLSTQGMYLEAAAVVEPLLTADSIPLDRLEVIFGAFYNSWQLAQAIGVVNRIEAEHGQIPPRIRRVAAEVQTQAGYLEEALRLYEPFVEQDASAKVEFAILLERLNRKEEAKGKALEMCAAQSIEVPVRLRLVVLLNHLGEADRAVEQAYLARRDAFDQQEVHVEYIQTMLRLRAPYGGNHFGRAFNIDFGDKQVWYTVTDLPNPKTSQEEVGTQSEIGKLLVGAQEGQVIAWPRGFPNTPSTDATIIEIIPSYMRALHHSQEVIEVRFPNNGEVMVFDTSRGVDKLVEAIFSNGSDIRERRAAALRQYREDVYTVVAVGRAFGLGEYETWVSALSTSSFLVHACSNSAQERSIGEAAVTNGTVAIDLSSLIVLHELQLLDLLPSQFGEILVARQTVDTLDSLDDVLGWSPPLPLSDSRPNDSQEDDVSAHLEQHRKRLEAIKQFVNDKCVVSGTHSLVGLPPDERGKLQGVLGLSGLATAMLAGEKGAAFMHEDLWVREISRAKWQANGFSTAWLVSSLEQNGKIEDGTVKMATFRMLEIGLRIVPISFGTVEYALEKGFASKEYNLLLKSFDKPETLDEQNIAWLLTRVAKELWEKTYLLKEAVLRDALDTLGRGRNRHRLVQRMRAMMPQVFSIAHQHHIAEVNLNLNDWLRLIR